MVTSLRAFAGGGHATTLRVPDRISRPAVTALSIIGVLAVPYINARNWGRSFLGIDAWAYWSVDLSNLYGRSLDNTDHQGAFRYMPPLGEAFSVFHIVPWELFLWAWLAVLVGALVWMAGWRLGIALIAFPPVALELFHGNVHLLMAVAIVLSFRWPALWALPILAKVTPGVGILWFLFRREWRSLALAMGTPLVIAGVSLAIAPDLWRQYIATMANNYAVVPEGAFPILVPLAVRLIAAACLVAWGARTDRRWTVAVAATLGLPIIWWHGLAVLVACIPLGLVGDRSTAVAHPDVRAPAAATLVA